MDQVHEKLDDAEFKRPNGIVSAKICEKTGKVATKKCTKTYTELFASGTVPSECTGHEPVKICKESKKLATEFCPKTEEKIYEVKPEKERNASWKTSEGKKYNEVKDTCTLHTEATMNSTVPNVVGKTEADAKVELRGFNIQIVYQEDTSKENGVVLRQSIKAGTSVAKGSKITLTVNSITPKPTPEPTPEPTPDPVNNTEVPINDTTSKPDDET